MNTRENSLKKPFKVVILLTCISLLFGVISNTSATTPTAQLLTDIRNLTTTDIEVMGSGQSDIQIGLPAHCQQLTLNNDLELNGNLALSQLQVNYGYHYPLERDCDALINACSLNPITLCIGFSSNHKQRSLACKIGNIKKQIILTKLLKQWARKSNMRKCPNIVG